MLFNGAAVQCERSFSLPGNGTRYTAIHIISHATLNRLYDCFSAAAMSKRLFDSTCTKCYNDCTTVRLTDDPCTRQANVEHLSSKKTARQLLDNHPADTDCSDD